MVRLMKALVFLLCTTAFLSVIFYTTFILQTNRAPPVITVSLETVYHSSRGISPHHTTSSFLSINHTTTSDPFISTSNPSIDSTTTSDRSIDNKTTSDPLIDHKTTRDPSVDHATTSDPSVDHATTSDPSINSDPSVHHKTTSVPSIHHKTTSDPSIHHKTTSDPSIHHKTTSVPSIHHKTTSVPSIHHKTTSDPSIHHKTTSVPSIHHKTTSVPSIHHKATSDPSIHHKATSVPSIHHKATSVPSIHHKTTSDPSINRTITRYLSMHRRSPIVYNSSKHNLTNSDIFNMTRVTQSDNLELRGKWQTAQVSKYCKKYGLEGQLYVLPTSPSEIYSLYRHLIFDPKREFIFCFLPKVGCSNLRRLIFVMQGVMPRESVAWERNNVTERDYRPGMNKFSFQKKGITNEIRLHKIRNYFKFVMVRNPLERLVSAFRDKIQPPLKFCGHDRLANPLLADLKHQGEISEFQAHRRFILSKYKPNSLINWARSNGSYNLSVDFRTYVRWVVDTKDADLNEHFSSIAFNSAPCRVGYDLFLNFKNYSRDVRLLIHRLNTSTEYFVDRNAHSSTGTDTRSILPHYYSQLSRSLKSRLFARMTRELDFYYHLYPEEQLSHLDLLRVKELVAAPHEYWE